VFPLGTTTITYTATDSSGNTTTATQTVTVKRPPLVVSAGPSQTSSEGATATFNLGSFTGGTGGWTVSVDWGDGTALSTFTASPGALSASHKYANDRATPYTVTVTVKDSSGASSSGSFSAIVKNLSPLV